MIKDELGNKIARIEEIQEELKDKEINSTLGIAIQGLGWAIDEIEEQEDKVDNLIQSIAS